jgi:hypothetical protein
MPPEGYKTITIRESLYDKLYEKYEKEKNYWSERGIPSFSAYVSHRLATMNESDSQHNDLNFDSGT